MRLRRETGDFSIVIDGTECQIRKGLSAEDLIGVIIQDGISAGVVTGTWINEATGTITLKCVDAAATPNDTFVYDPATGIVTYSQTT